MAFAFVGNNSATATGATEIDCNVSAGIAAGNLEVFVVAFEGVAAGSGPWIIPNNGQFSTNYIGPFTNWQQVLFQAPGAAGVGIEVWAAIYQTGTVHDAKFVTSQNAVGVACAWSGEYNPTGLISGGAIHASTSRQVTGDQPAAPSVTANSGDLVIAIGGDLMGGGGFGTPSGFTNRKDAARAGAGTVEATIADATTTSAAPTGLITFPNAAAASTTRGSTATLAVAAAPSAAGVGVVIEASLPPDLDLPDGYRLEWGAIDATTGGPVSGVTVTDVSIFGTALGTGSDGDLNLGPFMLVPGPGA